MNILETDLEFKSLNGRYDTNMIVIHHVGGVDRDYDATEIHGWHLEQGWAGIGYHFVIRKDGTIERGRPEWAIGAHAYGFNSESIGVNLAGNFDEGEPTKEQLNSLVELLQYLCGEYNIEPNKDNLVGHRDLMATACPGESLYKQLPEIIERVRLDGN